MRVGVAFSIALALIGGAACQDQGATPPVAASVTPDTVVLFLFGVWVVLLVFGVLCLLLFFVFVFFFVVFCCL